MDSDTGEPLSIGKTLNNLQDIAEEFAKSEILPGAEVDSVSAVIPSEHSFDIMHFPFINMTIL